MEQQNLGIRIMSNDIAIYGKLVDELEGFFDENFCWQLLFIKGVSTGSFQMVEFEELVESSRNGLILSINDLKGFTDKFRDIFDLTLIGNHNPNNEVTIHDSFEDIVASCILTIEMFDSSYWTIFSTNFAFIRKVESEFLNLYEINRIGW